MAWKKIGLLALFILFAAASASAYEISKQQFRIQVLEDGAGIVSEKYYFTFLDKEDSNAFLQTVKSNGQDLLVWSAFDERIAPHFETIEQLSLQSFSFDPNANALEIKYAPDRKVAEKTNENSRVEFWRLRPGLLQEFNLEGSLIIVPKGTSISIDFPANSVLSTELLPGTVASSKNSLSMTNVRISNLSIQYSIPKPIAQPAFINEFAKWLKDTGMVYVLIAAIIICAVVAIVKRRQISRKIEDYIAGHSEISAKEDEEVEIDD